MEIIYEKYGSVANKRSKWYNAPIIKIAGVNP